MSRLSPRVSVELPMSFELESTCSEALITDIGMGGAFIKYASSRKISLNVHGIAHYNINKKKFHTKGEVIRIDEHGYAIRFDGIGNVDKKYLWEYLSNNLKAVSYCQFCCQKFSEVTKICYRCNWNLEFKSPEYFDYYEKNSLLKKISASMSALELDDLLRVEQFIENGAFRAASATQGNEDEEFVGTCDAMMEIFSLIRKVAPTDISVLILGESGTGKEMTAQAIHERSSRKEKPFVAINCGAIPENLLESELFGHEKGAFTGAYAVKKGKFEHADGGTIFLDEIGEMPLTLQVKLLRFLQDRNVERVGSVSLRKVDIRIIAATNSDLRTSIADGKFRKDLFYRLNEFTINLPPIRERENDKLVLAKFFLEKFCREKGSVKTFGCEAADAVMSYEWPGNVREIINKVRRAIVMGGSNIITPQDLDLDFLRQAKTGENVRLSHALAQLEKQRIKEALNSCNNNISVAAGFLGITRQTLHRRIKLLDIRKMVTAGQN